MDYGAHLPVIDFGNQRYSLEHLCAYVRTARELGCKAISTNDHLIHSRPWLDAPTALAAILSHSGDIAVGTSILLSVVRGPVQMAKTLAAIDILSNGKLFVGIGPGSSARDYEIVGLDYEERWKRLDEAIQTLADAGITTFEVTAIDRDGLLRGPDLDLLRSVVALDGGRIIASAGIASVDDVRAVRDIGCAGAIVGRALYEGQLSLRDALAVAETS